MTLERGRILAIHLQTTISPSGREIHPTEIKKARRKERKKVRIKKKRNEIYIK